MRKKQIIILLFILTILATGCSKMSVESLAFPISEDMQLDSTRTNKVDKVNVELSTYTVKDGNLDSFLFEYEELLNSEGWVTTQNLKPNGLVIEKNNEKVTIIAYEKNGNLLVDIIPTPNVEN